MFFKPKYTRASGESKFMEISRGINIIVSSPNKVGNLTRTPVCAAFSKTRRIAPTHCCLMECFMSVDAPSCCPPRSAITGMYAIQNLELAAMVLELPTPMQIGVAYRPCACAPSQCSETHIGNVS